MIFGIGTDVVRLDRIEAAYARHGEHFVGRLLMPRGAGGVPRLQAPGALPRDAVRGQGGDRQGAGHGVRARHLDPRRRHRANAWGRPEVIWSERGRKVRDGLGAGEGHVTLTDEAGLVVAVAVLMRRELLVTISNVFAFDIETVPDVEFGRRLHGLEGLSDKQVGYVMQTRQREQTGSRVPVARAAAHRRDLGRDAHARRLQGLEPRRRDVAGGRAGAAASSTASSATRPTLVSWNGSGFDLPVLNYRAHAPPRAGASLLGDGRRGPVVPLEQLPRPLPLAAHRPHGRAVRLPGPRAASAWTAWRSCSACRASSGCRARASGTRTSRVARRTSATTARRTSSTPT